MKKPLILLMAALLVFGLAGCRQQALIAGIRPTAPQAAAGIRIDLRQAPDGLDENGVYTSLDEVAGYVHLYGRLPKNYITKDEAEERGWSGGGLHDFGENLRIGGDRFANYEGALPDGDGRKYTEADIADGEYRDRGARRLVFSNDGLVYYTADHYASFTLLHEEG